MLRTLFVAVFLSIYILIVGPPLLVWTLVTKNPNAIYWAGTNGVMFFVRLVGVRVRVVGTERIPAETCIFAANHTSSADAPAGVGGVPRRIAILLKKSLFAYPIVGAAFSSAGFIPVNRKERDSALESLDKAIESLKHGQSFLIYPEGTRSPDGRLQEFKKGAVVMSIKSGMPIVPVAWSGAHRVMDKRSLKISPGEIVVEFLAPIFPAGYDYETRDELNRQVHDARAAGLPADQRPVGFPGAA